MELEVVVKVDPKRVETEWSKTCCSRTWEQLPYGVQCGILQVIEACHEPGAATADPKRIETEWNKRCRIGGFGRWRELTSDTRRMLREFVEACHEPVELTEEDVRRCYEQLRGFRGGLCTWAHLSQHDKDTYSAFSSILRRYTPPSLPAKLARAVEALGDEHPEAVRILKEAADAHG